MNIKNRIMRKLFIGNLVIFTFLLLIQLVFQTLFFEPFLTGEQKKRLQKNVEGIQSSILNDDEDKARRQINEGVNRGMVIAAVDQDMNQIYGQSFEQYQRCFTIEDDHGKQYSVVEDYLESVPLQTINVGDEISIEGYLVDEHNALIIPSKVCRSKDGIVLGTDTFLFVNHPKETQVAEPPESIVVASDETTSPKAGIATTDDTPVISLGKGVVISDNAMVGRGIVISDEGDPVHSPVTVKQTSVTSASDAKPASSDSSATKAVGSQQDESNWPKGFVLQSPFDTSGDNDSLELSGSLSVGQQNLTLRAERMLIIDGGGRNGDSFPISINGRVADKADLSNNDLIIQRGLITDEIKRLSAKSNPAASVGTHTVTSQLITGKYLLYVSRLAESQITVIGAISLYSIQDMNRLLNTFHVLLFIAELGLVIGAIYFFSRMISKPLVAMNGVALKIASQDFSSKVNVTSNDEIGTLGVSINEISTNLEQKIHQINEINDQLQQDNERQLDMQKRHKQLSASFSHELKTPLTIVRGCIDSIQSGIYPKDEMEYYGIALRELDSASNLITQMLEIARMESPYFTLNKNVVDLWMVFFKVYDELKQTMDQRGMKVQFVAEDEANTIADAELLERVVSNILINAMKYSPEGSKIAVRITTIQDRHIFSVENDNSFIPPEDLKKIWQPFYRVGKSQANTVSGTGLGLMIVSEILNSHGFTYGIRNTDHGVEFSFSCPALPTSFEQEETV